MGKAISDVPSECRPWFKVFERIAYRWQYSEVFSDYLDILMNWFANGTLTEIRDASMKKYSSEEKQLFNELFFEHIRLMEKKILVQGCKWYDSLGDIYQAISSSSKSSAMGQFFTPDTVTDFIAQILGVNEQPYNFINEPCAGSGRMILSAHALQPLNYYWAIDLDAMCVKMTAINMCFHNAAGVVSHGDALWIENTNYNHYIISRVQLNEQTFVPLITMVDYEKAKEHLNYLDWYTTIMKGGKYVKPEDRPVVKHEIAPERIEKIKTKVKNKENQLSLF